MDNVNGHRQVTHVPDHGLVHFVTSATRLGPETTAQANDSEWRVAGVSREIASRALEIAAGRQRSRDLRGSADKSRQNRGPGAAPALGPRCVFPPPSSVFAAQWFLARSRQCDEVVLGRLPFARSMR